MDLTGVSSVFDFGSKVIDKIFTDKNVAEKAKVDLLALDKSGELETLALRYGAIVSEANSDDVWVKRARPTFMYVVYIYILAAIPMGFMFAISPESANAVSVGVKAWLDAIPEAMWGTFGVGYLGYSAVRSYDKKQSLKQK